MELTRACPTPVPITSKSADFTLYRGITFRPVFKFKDVNSDPLPIAGKIITFHIADDEGTDLLTIDSESTNSNGSGVIITNDALGIADILITDEETLELDFEEAKWWVTLTLLNGDIVLRGKGSISLTEPYN